MLKNADGAEDVPDDLGLAREVRGVTQDHLSLRLKLHLFDTSHGGLDTNGLVAFILDLVDVGVEHVSATVDGGQAGKALGEFTQAVQRVNVGRLAVASNGVSVEADSLDSFRSLARVGNVVIGKVKGHGMANEILSTSLKAELVKDLLHSASVHVKA